MTLRYILCMLSVLLVDAGITTTFVSLTGQYEVLPTAVAISVIVLAGVNLAGALVIFRPIARYLAGRADLSSARRRILHLPILSTGWAVIVAFSYSTVIALAGVFTPADIGEGTSFGLRLLMFCWFTFVYSTYMGFVVYFATADLTAGLRERVFARDRVILSTGRGRLGHRLVVVFLVVTVMPVGLVLADLALFREIRALQGLGVVQVVLLDLFGALFAAAVSLIFVTRRLVRPINGMMKALRRVRRGDLDAYVPVTSDDELGVLAANFNDMVAGLQDREFVRETFGRYVSADVAEAILRTRGRGQGGRHDGGRLMGEVGVATVIFTDIENFSDLAGSMAPTAVLDLLNDYLATIAEPIQRHGGIINNFIGDALLATFNLPVTDPDHAANAVRAALEIQATLAARRFGDGIRLKTRIGINTGEVVAGSVGPADRLAFTVLGAEVNLAARLEALNKQYAHETGSRILVGEGTFALTRDRFGYERISAVTVKGKADPVSIYRLLDTSPPIAAAPDTAAPDTAAPDTAAPDTAADAPASFR